MTNAEPGTLEAVGASEAPCITWGLARTWLEPKWDPKLGCDKLRLVGWVPEGFDGRLWGLTMGPEHAGRRVGVQAVRIREAWYGAKGRACLFRLLAYDGLQGRKLLCDFSPKVLGPEGCADVGQILMGAGMDPLRMWVERFDVAWDIRGDDRYRFRLDEGRSRKDQLGVTRRGPQTERIGFWKGSKRKVQLYDKAAERVAKASERHPDGWMRLEVQAWAPFVVEGDMADPRDVELRELELVACPMPAEVTIRALADPAAFRDGRYLALSCVAWVYGTRCAEAAARQVLSNGSRHRDGLRYFAWPEVEPSPGYVFGRDWASTIDRVRCDLTRRP